MAPPTLHAAPPPLLSHHTTSMCITTTLPMPKHIYPPATHAVKAPSIAPHISPVKPVPMHRSSSHVPLPCAHPLHCTHSLFLQTCMRTSIPSLSTSFVPAVPCTSCVDHGWLRCRAHDHTRAQPPQGRPSAAGHAAPFPQAATMKVTRGPLHRASHPPRRQADQWKLHTVATQP